MVSKQLSGAGDNYLTYIAVYFPYKKHLHWETKEDTCIMISTDR